MLVVVDVVVDDVVLVVVDDVVLVVDDSAITNMIATAQNRGHDLKPPRRLIPFAGGLLGMVMIRMG